MNMKRKLSKKSVLLTIAMAIAIIATIAVIVVVRVHNRRYDDALAEVIIWPGAGFARGTLVYRFVVTNDGTLISYYGYNLTDNNFEWITDYRFERRHDTLRFIRQRRRTTLSVEDFLRISELVDEIVALEYWERNAVLSQVHMIFLHNGNVYEGGTGSIPLNELVDTIGRLSPLSIRWH